MSRSLPGCGIPTLARLLVVALACTLCAGLPANASPWRAKAESIAHVAVADGLSRGVVVAWVSPEDRGWVSAGNSGNAQRPAIDDRTLFEIGSITKTFTASLLATAVETGDLALADRLDQLAPELRLGNAAIGAITLAELATHTSGLPRLPLSSQGTKRLLFNFNNPYRGTAVSELWEHLAHPSLIEAGPEGKKPQQYSNFGFALLGQLLAKRLHADYAELIAARLLRPLGMNHTQVHAPLAQRPLLAQGHKTNFRPTENWDLDAYAPAGGIWSNAGDLGRYLAAQIDQSAPGARLAQTLRVAPPLWPHAMGLGWFIEYYEGRQAYWHNGGTGGFRSFIAFEPAARSGVVVLSNTAQDIDDLGWHLLLDKPMTPRESTWSSQTLTVLLTLLGPYGLWRLRRQLQAPMGLARPAAASKPWLADISKALRRSREHDRLSVVSTVVSAGFLMTLSRALGAWQFLPMELWWLALAGTTLLAARLWQPARTLPWTLARSWWHWLGWWAGMILMSAGAPALYLFA
ncbi:D-alanyl-D-alanine-carboxypeptidase/endopeptidaseAmpH [Burkholderiales bacterium]|nr:D-alanyl-D-alanine-carboxypeptidase/endopeptidaseAmpH [Burkholderiales bacterium]